MGDPSKVKLLTTRTTLILLLAVLIGAAVGGLTYLAEDSIPRALLAALGAAGAVLVTAPHLVD